MTKLSVVFLLLSPLALWAQGPAQGGGLHITHLYLPQGARFVQVDRSTVSVRHFLLADTIPSAPIGYEWTKKDDRYDDGWGQDFTWVPAGGPATRLYVQLGLQQMVIDFSHLRPATPAGDPEIVDTLVFRPGYFQVALQPAPLQWRKGQFYVIHSYQQVQRATIYHHRVRPALLLPGRLRKKE